MFTSTKLLLSVTGSLSHRRSSHHHSVFKMKQWVHNNTSSGLSICLCFHFTGQPERPQRRDFDELWGYLVENLYERPQVTEMESHTSTTGCETPFLFLPFLWMVKNIYSLFIYLFIYLLLEKWSPLTLTACPGKYGVKHLFKWILLRILKALRWTATASGAARPTLG